MNTAKRRETYTLNGFGRHEYVAYIERLLLHHPLIATVVLVNIESDQERYLFVRDVLFKESVETYIRYKKGYVRNLAVKYSVLAILKNEFIAKSPQVGKLDIRGLLDSVLHETISITDIGASLDVDYLRSITYKAYPDLFSLSPNVQNSHEISLFAKLYLRRGKCFIPNNVKYVSKKLGIPLAEAKRKKIFTNAELSVLFKLSEHSINQIFSGEAGPTEITAVYKKANHLLNRELREPRLRLKKSSHNLVATSNGLSWMFVDDIDRFFEGAAEKYLRMNKDKSEEES